MNNKLTVLMDTVVFKFKCNSMIFLLKNFQNVIKAKRSACNVVTQNPVCNTEIELSRTSSIPACMSQTTFCVPKRRLCIILSSVINSESISGSNLTTSPYQVLPILSHNVGKANLICVSLPYSL